MAEKRKLAFYIRLSDADEEVKAGTKDESNSITGQRKLLYAYIKKTEEFAGFEVLEYFDDGDRKSTRLNSSHIEESRMPSSA